MSSTIGKDFYLSELNTSNFGEIFSQLSTKFSEDAFDKKEIQEGQVESCAFSLFENEEIFSKDFFEESEIGELTAIVSTLNESIQLNFIDLSPQNPKEERDECKGEILSILMKKPISTKNARVKNMPVCFGGQQRKISLAGRVWVNSTQNSSLPTQYSSTMNESENLRSSMK